MTDDVVLYAHAPDAGQAFARRWRGAEPAFVCVLAHTDTCLIPGVSAAGLDLSLRALTPAADAEAVLLGRPVCLPGVPSNPLGAPGPAPITRAAIVLAELPATFYAVGLRVWPQAPVQRIQCAPGGRIDHGGAVPEARGLFERGQSVGADLVGRHGRLVVGESVPGGTTTALAVLLALGLPAIGRVSGSMPGNAHSLKNQVALAALRASGIRQGDGRGDPMGAAAAVGDPMQPFAAGLLLGALGAGGEVLLAGGSQMIAVAALAAAYAGREALTGAAVGTTRWVAQDPAADVPSLAGSVSPDLPLLAAALDFSTSRHAGLREYERFLVKEGVGAGGACIAAHWKKDTSRVHLQAAIDAAYDVVLRPAEPRPSPDPLECPEPVLASE